MIKQNLIIYRIPQLYYILKELELIFNFKLVNVLNKKELINYHSSNNLILTHDAVFSNLNCLKIKSPIKVLKLIEKININLLKLRTREKSSINIGDYKLDLNSRKITLNNISTNLTEKEINLILFLNDANNSVEIQKLQSEVWKYKLDLETHTVETHIHRLRKKIHKDLNKNDFILSNKNGYFLNKNLS
jgi:DNA-binding winged helix-turn-helix (wHTH) protein